MSSRNKIVLTGATGYVGGTVLDHLIKDTSQSLKDVTIDVLVRKEDQAEKLLEAYKDRIGTILWKGLTDEEFIINTAANYDIVINAGSGFFPAGAAAFVEGLARRVKNGERAPWMIHIAGCTNLSDLPITGKAYPDREWDDADGNAIYEFLKSEDEKSPYLQRTAEVAVLTRAEETGVQAVSLNTPGIYGLGTGLFNRSGLVIPSGLRYVITKGYGRKVLDTTSFDLVHVEDLADLYLLLVRAILEREDRGVGFIPSGKSGIIFPAVLRASSIEIMQLCLDAAFEEGVLPREDTPKEKEIKRVTLKQMADEVTFGMQEVAERLVGHKAQKGTVAKRLLGWEPKRLDEDWKQDFKDELLALRAGKRGKIGDGAIGLN
ncbi:unnamed protein product [Clonostachys rhizophaga]|uniref:NAD-dependent epimerase/dehydratase domain-containing protein n=1 Tax=Clonostachys rhizophaga TaxID=160324 RepID=A0A9N9VPT4_9HYPO|nr:unnamed protein product [Clonostachys rhizophaga]